METLAELPFIGDQVVLLKPRSGRWPPGGDSERPGAASWSPRAPICAWRIVLRLAYHFGEPRTRFTTDRDIRKARAMSATFTPALNDARMRFAVPSGIFSIPVILLLRVVVVWRCDDALVAAAAAVSLLGPP